MSAKDCYSRWKDWANTLGSWADFAFLAVGGDALGGGVLAGDYYFLQNGWTIVPQDASHTLLVSGNIYPATPGAQMFGTRAGRTIQVQLSRSSLTQTIAVGSGVLPTDITAIATASRDAILTDGTRFPGAYIYAAISSVGGGTGGLTVAQDAALTRIDGHVDADVSSRSVAGEGLTVGQASALTSINTRVDAAVSTRATAGQGLTIEQAAVIVELQLRLAEAWRTMGLDVTAPLVVDANSRTAGTITQTLEEIAGVVTVTRTA